MCGTNKTEDAARERIASLFERDQAAISRFTARICFGSGVCADDVMSMYIVKIMLTPNYSGEASFKTWSCRIIMRIFLDEKRRLTRQKNVSLEDLKTPLMIEDLGISEITNPDEHAEILNAILSGSFLQPLEIRLIETILYEEMTMEEIAEASGEKLGALKSRWHRIKLKIRGRYGVGR